MVRMTPELISRARSGDREAFRELTEPHRRELRVHCYRMLGSFQEAEDVLQEALLAAWQGLPGYEERASLRTWLYRIATNRCLNARRAASRRPARPAKEWDLPGVERPEPTGLGEVLWLEPFPDVLLDDGALDLPADPEVRYLQSESISLAFVTALQLLPPRQLAVLILFDILGFEAREVAQMLDSTQGSVQSALKRARANLEAGRSAAVIGPPPPPSRSPAEEAVAASFARAYQAADLDGLVALLTDDVFISMPPLPLEYRGHDAARRFFGPIFGAGRTLDLLPTRANDQPAFGAYLRTASGPRPAVGLFVLALRGDRICAMTRFEPSVLGWFGLPPSLG
jgi:RNA polymerase sigma-70 factor (TIGR02960 family)